MTHSSDDTRDDEVEPLQSDPLYTGELHHTSEEPFPMRSEPLDHERVIAEIIQAIRGIRPSFPAAELNGNTNLALDLGLQSASRVELLLDVRHRLDIALDVEVVAVFAELTIAELAELIVGLADGLRTD